MNKAPAFRLTKEMLEDALKTPLAPWQTAFLHGEYVSWQYTPADELRNRLNDRLQGKDPAAVINTRYWRGL